MLRANGKGSCLMDVQFVGGEKTEIAVDSGAEESVCPWRWGGGEQLKIEPPDRPMRVKRERGIH